MWLCLHRCHIVVYLWMIVNQIKLAYFFSYCMFVKDIHVCVFITMLSFDIYIYEYLFLNYTSINLKTSISIVEMTMWYQY